jgi:hypothetical protein
VITGFNTDIEHDGVVYHVQTEDKGLESPLILSLVYSGGAILASKRSRYEDLIANGFNEEVLAQRVMRQHRLICAAINAGRLEDLKRMGAHALTEPTRSGSPASEAPEVKVAAEQFPTGPTGVSERESPAKKAPTRSKRSLPKESPYTVHDPRRESPLGNVAESETGLVLILLEENEFHAGEDFTIRILVKNRADDIERPIGDLPVSVRILGTTFRPQLYSVKTGRDGVAVVSATIPQFNSGRAAILIRAVMNSEATELRRVIYPAR